MRAIAKKLAPLLVATILSSALSACSHRRVQSAGTGPETQNQSADVVGPQLPGADDKAYDQPIGPEPLPGPAMPEGYEVAEKAGYVVVLGPGLARTSAYIGVLRELAQSSVPINAIVGVGMGAVVGALYSVRGLNALEWYFDKLSEKTFLDFPLIRLGNQESKGDAFDKFLRSAFKDKTFADAKTKLYVVTADSDQEEIIVESEGKLVDALHAAVALPGFMRSKPLTKDPQNPRVSAVMVRPFPIEFAKSLEAGKIIAVDVLGDGAQDGEIRSEDHKRIADMMKTAANRGRSDLEDADVVVSVKTGNVSYLDFSTRAELAYRGRSAAKATLSKETKD